MENFEMSAGVEMKIFSPFISMIFLLSACGPGGFIKPEITETPTPLPPTNTPTLTLTPTVTATPTETSTPTITPTPLGGSANLVYAYFSMDRDDPETANALLNVVQSGETLSIPIETTFTPFYESPETLLAPSLAISPDASRVMAVVNGEDSAALIEVNLRDPNPTAQFVTALPEHGQVSELGFSPDGLWVYVNYLVGRQRYVGFLKIGTEKFIVNYDCESILGFNTNEIAICRTGRGVHDIGKLMLGHFTMDDSYLDIPGGKFYSATHFNWGFKAVVPAMNSFVLEREDGSFFLVPNLDAFSSLSYWYSEDVDKAVNSPVIAELPPGAYVFQFLPSPDKEQIAVTGINSRGLGFGAGIDPRTFTLVTDPGETYQPEDPEIPGTPFYALKWSPDSRVLVGLSLGGNLSIWDPVTRETEVLHSNSAQPKISFLNTDVSGIAVEWLEQ